MIGDIVHFTKASADASRKPRCHPAIVMGELPNDKLDILVFALASPANGRVSISKGERTRVESWHNANHEEK